MNRLRSDPSAADFLAGANPHAPGRDRSGRAPVTPPAFARWVRRLHSILALRAAARADRRRAVEQLIEVADDAQAEYRLIRRLGRELAKARRAQAHHDERAGRVIQADMNAVIHRASVLAGYATLMADMYRLASTAPDVCPSSRSLAAHSLRTLSSIRRVLQRRVAAASAHSGRDVHAVAHGAPDSERPWGRGARSR